MTGERFWNNEGVYVVNCSVLTLETGSALNNESGRDKTVVSTI